MSDKVIELPKLPVTRNGVTFNFEHRAASRGELKGQFYPDMPALKVERDFDAFVEFVGKDWLLQKGLQSFTGVSFEAFKESIAVDSGEKNAEGETIYTYGVFDDNAKAKYLDYIQKLTVRGETLAELEEQYEAKMALLTAAADRVNFDDPAEIANNPDALAALRELSDLRKEVKEIKHAMENRRRTVKKAA